MSRIPDYDAENPDGMLLWFSEMQARNLLFHPDDDPADVIDVRSDVHSDRLFTAEEASTLRTILGSMFAEHGDDVYEAAYPIVMRSVGVRLDA